MDGKRIRAFYANATAWSFDSDAEPHIVAARERQAAEFARWLDRVRAVARREGQAEAWDEGFEVGTEAGGRLAENGGPDNDDRNPYRNGEGQ